MDRRPAGESPAVALRIQRDDVHDGVLWILQNKTGVKRPIELMGELAQLVARINARPHERRRPS